MFYWKFCLPRHGTGVSYRRCRSWAFLAPRASNHNGSPITEIVNFKESQLFTEYPSFAFNNLRFVMRKKKIFFIQYFALNVISVNSNSHVQIIFPESP